MTGRRVWVGETFDLGPVVAVSRFKYCWHPEILAGSDSLANANGSPATPSCTPIRGATRHTPRYPRRHPLRNLSPVAQKRLDPGGFRPGVTQHQSGAVRLKLITPLTVRPPAPVIRYPFDPIQRQGTAPRKTAPVITRTTETGWRRALRFLPCGPESPGDEQPEESNDRLCFRADDNRCAALQCAGVFLQRSGNRERRSPSLTNARESER